MAIRSIALAALLAGAVSCASTGREQEIAELRRQLEEARAQLAQAEAARVLAEERAALPQTLFRQAQALEEEGQGREAVQLYIRAARMGLGKAALRLGEIYSKGISGVARDFAESLKWYNAARVMGESVQLKP